MTSYKRRHSHGAFGHPHAVQARFGIRGNDCTTVNKAVPTRLVDPDRTSSSNKPKRVALAFYGLTRSLQYTIQSIREQVFDKLSDAGYEFHVYLHTYDLTKLDKSRSGEATVLNKTEWRLLNADFHKITQQVWITKGSLASSFYAPVSCYNKFVLLEQLYQDNCHHMSVPYCRMLSWRSINYRLRLARCFP